MVLAIAVLAQAFASLPLEIDARGVEEHQFQARKQIPPPGKQPFFDQVLSAAWSQTLVRGLFRRWQRFAQPPHGPIQMVQFEVLDPRQSVTTAPPLGGAVAAGNHQPMEHGHQHGTLHGELELATPEQGVENLR